MDGWSAYNIVRELQETYYCLLNNRPIEYKPAPQYSEYFKKLSKVDYATGKLFWDEYLKGYDKSVIPIGKDESAEKLFVQNIYSFTIGKKRSTELRNMALKNNVTLNIVFNVIWGLLLSKYNFTEDVVYGVIVSGRNIDLAEIDDLVGLLINLVAIRIQFDLNTSINELLKKVQEKFLECDRYSHHPLAEILVDKTAGTELINHIMVYQNYPSIESPVKKTENTNLSLSNSTLYEKTNYDFNLTVYPDPDIKIGIKYDTGIYQSDNIRSISYHMIELINSLLDANTKLVKDLRFLSLQEKKVIIDRFCKGSECLYNYDTIQEQFERQVEQNPDKTVLIYNDEAITYQSFNNEINRIAHFLLDIGVYNETIIVICMKRSPRMLAAILAVIKAGGAYLVIDVDYPEERIDSIINEAFASLVLADDGIDKKIVAECPVISMDDKPEYDYPMDNPAIGLSFHSLMYVLCTSGSTGTPKLIMVEQRNVLNYIQAL
jgi:non-ribosomal peptide synthetase component F